MKYLRCQQTRITEPSSPHQAQYAPIQAEQACQNVALFSILTLVVIILLMDENAKEKISAEDLLNFVKEPFSLTPENRKNILEAIESNADVKATYEILKQQSRSDTSSGDDENNDEYREVVE